jgi:hypothetical protein
MRKIIPFILLFCLSVGMSLSYGESESNEVDPFLVKMFSDAKAHNVKALEELRDQIKMKNNRDLTSAYSLALYIASPKKYKQEYFDNFPVDSDGLSYFNEIELKELTPAFLYYIDAIGLIAEEGNDQAIEKVIIGFNHSDGGGAELFCDYLIRLFDEQLHKTMKAFFRIDEAQRQKAYSCFETIDTKEFSSLKNKLKKLKATAIKSEMKIIREIENYQ